MPELPEVETIRRHLAGRLLGRIIEQVELVEPFMLRDADEEELRAELPGARVEDLERQGKFLVLVLSNGLFLTVHLGMTGQLLLLPESEPFPPHSRFAFRLNPDGSGCHHLVFRDIRKFGRLHLTAGRHPERLLPLGPDALEGDWNAAFLADLLRDRRAPLKAFLLDQRRLAGIGNIYADEILWGARLSPLRPAGSLSGEEIVRLSEQIRLQLAEGVRRKGSSISDFVDPDGQRGGMQEVLQAYGRHGEPCARCGTLLSRTVVAGRGTAFCPSCQS
jgi:formamidopyrimidine-DNA glycosylase